MEDEDRDLPPGWVRQFDSNQNQCVPHPGQGARIHRYPTATFT